MDIIPLSLFLIEQKRLIVGSHLIGVILGFGGALCADFLFIRFISNGSISHEEHSGLKVISQIIWVGVIVITISGILLFLTEPYFYINSSKFLAKMFIVVIIVINGFVLNKVIHPKLTSIPFNQFLTSTEVNIRETRKLAFALGAVSFTSWWTTFSLGWVRVTSFSLVSILAIYFSVLLVAVVISQIVESYIMKRKIQQSNPPSPNPAPQNPQPPVANTTPQNPPQNPA